MSDGTPPTATSKPTTRSRGTARPRGGVQRQSKAERDQFAEEEAKRNAARAAEHQTASRGTRGGRVVRDGRDKAALAERQGPLGGGGVFGGGSGGTTTQTKKKYEGFAELVDGGVKAPVPEDPSHGEIVEAAAKKTKSTSRPGGASKGGTTTATAPPAVETIETVTDDEADDVPKRDIDRIWVSSDEDEDAVTSTTRKGKQKATATSHKTSRAGFGLRPVRAPRTVREDGGKDGQADPSSHKKRAPTGRKSDTEPQEVFSDDSDDDAMEVDTDSVQVLKDNLSSPESRRRALKNKPGQVAPSKYNRDTKSLANETTEDRAERLRAQDDVEKMRAIFASKADQSQLDDDEDEPTDPFEDGKLFLFQLPPLTPFLTDPTSTENLAVKTEPSARANGATIDLDTIPDAPPLTTATRTDGPIKTDPELDNPSSKMHHKNLQLEGLLTAAEPIRLPAGAVGKLNVHRSGKVTLDWGGTDMEVRLGSEVDFLQDVVLVQPPGEGDAMDLDVDEDQGGFKKEGNGKAFALGHVRQKMVLIPDWAKLYD